MGSRSLPETAGPPFARLHPHQTRRHAVLMADTTVKRAGTTYHVHTCESGKVSVRGYWRRLKTKRRKRRAAGPRKPPAGPYWVLVDDHGNQAPGHHRTLTGANRKARALERAERNRRAQMTRQQVKAAGKANSWIPERRNADKG